MEATGTDSTFRHDSVVQLFVTPEEHLHLEIEAGRPRPEVLVTTADLLAAKKALGKEVGEWVDAAMTAGYAVDVVRLMEGVAPVPRILVRNARVHERISVSHRQGHVRVDPSFIGVRTITVDPLPRVDPMPNPAQQELDLRFTYHPPKPGQQIRYVALRERGHGLASLVQRECPESREKALALTKIEEAIMWANAAIARRS